MNDFVYGKKNAELPRIGFVFTGQNAQWPQMGKALIETFPSAKLILEELDEVLQSVRDPPSWSLIRKFTSPFRLSCIR
jgi:acyl transferase domain-containing protein